MGRKKPREIGAFFWALLSIYILKFVVCDNRKIINANMLLWKRLWLTVYLVKSLVTHWYVVSFFYVLELLYFELPTNPQINSSRLAGIHINLMLKRDK